MFVKGRERFARTSRQPKRAERKHSLCVDDMAEDLCKCPSVRRVRYGGGLKRDGFCPALKFKILLPEFRDGISVSCRASQVFLKIGFVHFVIRSMYACLCFIAAPVSFGRCAYQSTSPFVLVQGRNRRVVAIRYVLWRCGNLPISHPLRESESRLRSSNDESPLRFSEQAYDQIPRRFALPRTFAPIWHGSHGSTIRS